MTKFAIKNANILTPQGFKSAHSLVIEDGIITDICTNDALTQDIALECDLGGKSLIPGLIDLQVNGGGGVLFNDEPNVDGIRAIASAHRKFGTTGLLPTLISDDPDIMVQAITAVDQAIAQGVPGILGIHLEGPFLNAEKRGVHDASKFTQIGDDEIKRLSSLQRGKTLVTLAPEMTAPHIIDELSARGIIVCAGHTQATYNEALGALEAGLTGFTHLYNANRQLHSREPGLIAAALEDARAWCGVIADGYHVHPAMLRLAYRAKGGEQIFLVTDAMPSVGMASVDIKDKNFKLGGVQIHVSNGRCVTKDGTLAGSDLDMMSAVHNAASFLDIPLAKAVDMASRVPAQFLRLGHERGDIRAGARADFCVLSDTGAVLETWIAGQRP